MLPKAAVVCALLALFSAGSQGNKEANVYNHHLAASKERVLQFVDKLAVFRKDSDTCSGIIEYNRRLHLLQCDEEYIQAVFRDIETSNCSNMFYNNTLLYSRCGTNRNGTVCADIEDSIQDNLYSQCHRSFDTSECSSGCRTMLRQLSDSVGCCIHANYDARTPSLWMNCDIEQPEVCHDTPNAVDIVAKRNVDPCSYKCSLRQYHYTFCKYLGEEYEKLNRECEREVVVNLCGFDKGEFCIKMNYSIVTSHFDTIHDECYSNSEEGDVKDDVCSTKCRNALEETIDTVGCCFVYWNSSIIRSSMLSSDIFSACGIEVPDACSSFRSSTVPDDYLECAGLTINGGAGLQSGVYSIGLIIIGLIATYI